MKKLVPELHDILKLCHPTQFTPSGRKYSPHANVYRVAEYIKGKNKSLMDNPTIRGILHHHEHESFRIYPNSSETFMIDIADNLAAAMSRGKIKRWKYGWDHKIFKLWNNDRTDLQPFRKETFFDLDWILNFVENENGFEEFENECQKFKDNPLYIRAENSVCGSNLTSLYTHLVLSGKFYRLLEKCNYTVSGDHFTKDKRNRKAVSKLRLKKTSEWTFAVCHAKLKFPQHPVRTKDMNVFELFNNIKNNIAQKFSDEVFFNSTDEILFVLPPNFELESISELLDYGFWIDYRIELQSLNNPSPVLSSKSIKEGVLYKQLDPKIEPPICEICQMDKATKEWPKDFVLPENFEEDITKEDLCDNCFRIRTSRPDERLHKLKEWSEQDETVTVAWIKLALSLDQLLNDLHQLHYNLLRELKPDDKIEVDKPRFSVLFEFYNDYKNYLIEFKGHLHQLFGESLEVNPLDNLFIMKIERYSDIILILEINKILMEKYFNKFFKLASSPIKLAITVSNSKFPFFEHLRILDNPKSDNYVCLVGKGEMKASLKNLDQILSASRNFDKLQLKHKLHNLAEIAQLSESLARYTLKGDKEFSILNSNLPMGLDFKSILTFSKIIGD